jgi:hypothetical protein
MNLHPEEIEERKAAFQKLWRERLMATVDQFPPHLQGIAHDMLKRSFKAGSNYERRKAICAFGGEAILVPCGSRLR